MKLKNKLSLFSLGFAAITLAASLTASATTIDFSGCTSGCKNGTIKSIIDSGFTVTSTLGTWDWNSGGRSGNAYLSTTVSKATVSDEKPTFKGRGPAPEPKKKDGQSAITITKTGGGLFYFDSVDIKGSGSEGEDGSLSYTVIGIGKDGYTFTCKVKNGKYTTCSDAKDEHKLVSSVEILIDNGTGNCKSVFIDNIDVSSVATPEPSGFLLFGSGLFGLILLARRRFAADRV